MCIESCLDAHMPGWCWSMTLFRYIHYIYQLWLVWRRRKTCRFGFSGIICFTCSLYIVHCSPFMSFVSFLGTCLFMKSYQRRRIVNNRWPWIITHGLDRYIFETHQKKNTPSILLRIFLCFVIHGIICIIFILILHTLLSYW